MSGQHKGRQRHAAGRPSTDVVEAELKSLAALSMKQLKKTWAERLSTTPPALRSRDIFLRLLAWQIQAKQFGEVDTLTAHKLRDIAKSLERDGTYEPQIRHDLSPGVVLTREWKGVLYKVTATADGFQHQGKRYKSLSDIARRITGTRWSGPRFFGLEQKKARPARQASS